MNFLAHLSLSGTHPDVILGNFMADAIKGRSYLDYPENISKGIQLHRFIDDFADHHESSIPFRRILAKHLGLYAPVAMDMVNDHILANCWNDFHDSDLAEFIDQCYEILTKRNAMMPLKTQHLYFAMRDGNWLLSYREHDGMVSALRGLGRRVRNQPKLEIAAELFKENEQMVRESFFSLYPEVLNHCREKLEAWRL